MGCNCFAYLQHGVFNGATRLWEVLVCILGLIQCDAPQLVVHVRALTHATGSYGLRADAAGSTITTARTSTNIRNGRNRWGCVSVVPWCVAVLGVVTNNNTNNTPPQRSPKMIVTKANSEQGAMRVTAWKVNEATVATCYNCNMYMVRCWCRHGCCCGV